MQGANSTRELDSWLKEWEKGRNKAREQERGAMTAMIGGAGVGPAKKRELQDKGGEHNTKSRGKKLKYCRLEEWGEPEKEEIHQEQTEALPPLELGEPRHRDKTTPSVPAPHPPTRGTRQGSRRLIQTLLTSMLPRIEEVPPELTGFTPNSDQRAKPVDKVPMSLEGGITSPISNQNTMDIPRTDMDDVPPPDVPCNDEKEGAQALPSIGIIRKEPMQEDDIQTMEE